MCGILCLIGSAEPIENGKRQHVLELSKRIRHRGPDWSGMHVQKINEKHYNCLSHERLSIVDVLHGAQPLLNEDESIALCVNGEIYNHQIIRKELAAKHSFRTNSDCEVILHLYEEFGAGVCERLDGIFAFVISDKKTGDVLAARDPFGVCPLYIGYRKNGEIWFCSEAKGLTDDVEKFETFPPGHYWSSKDKKFVRWFNPPWVLSDARPTKKVDLAMLRSLFDEAVRKRLMTDVPYGVLLSGGLDSSLVAAVAIRHAAKRVEDNEQSAAWYPRLHTFSIGLENSPDLKFAREAAKFLNTVHHEFHFTVQEGLDAIKDVIYHLETFDVTTIRASTPMYLLSRRIKSMGVKMVLSGEGSDEIFGGYLYFHKAPNAEEFHKETCTKIKLLHLYDNLRANKSTMAWGLEARVPFLDKAFVNYCMSIDPEDKMIKKAEGRMEKYILRKAFDTPEDPYLPHSILWRQKEQFSDGVGYNWIDTLKAMTENIVTDEMWANREKRFPVKPPTTKEAYYYRTIFEEHFPHPSAVESVPWGPSVACSTPAAIAWDKAFQNNADPSGRMVNVHDSTVVS
eukprot:tig00000241_g20986.t1